MLRKHTVAAIRAHAIEAYPEESCGLIVADGRKERYVPCTNTLETEQQRRESFRIGRAELAQAAEQGEVIAYVHSHPDASNKPSDGDLVSMEATGLPWVIVSSFIDLEGDGAPTAGEPALYHPSGYEAPLEGRMFHHGVLDCYTLIRDYYARVLGKTLPDFERDDLWWERPGDSLYLQHFHSAGFVSVGQDLASVREHDVILMELMSVSGPNHGAVYVGDGLILHHCYGRLSCKEIYGGYWQNMTRMVLRHKDLL